MTLPSLPANGAPWRDWAQAVHDTVTDLEGATVADATTTAKGIVELATTAETTTGTDTARAVTPAGVKAVADTKEAAGAAATAQAFAVQRANHTGTQSADTLTDGTTNKAFLATERTKLSGIATGATANSTDATLLARANHTGTQAASTITGLAAVATSGAYTDLSGKPTIPAVNYVSAADYGFLTTATAAANNTAFAAAVTAARTAGKSLYIPGAGQANPYLVSAPLDLTAGMINVFGDPGQTFISNTSNTSALITCGGSSGRIADIQIRHTTTLDANTGNGIEVNNVDSWKFERVAVYSAGWAFKQTGGFFFSNYMEGMNLKRFWSGGIHITGGTGSQWNNTYINNQESGAPQTCTNSVVRLEELDESVFNQLNIEWAIPNGQALLCNGARTVNFNSLHIEQVNMFYFDSQMVRGFGNSRMIIDAMTVKHCNIAPAGSQGGGRTLVGIGGGASMDIRGLTVEDNTNTAAQAAKLAATDSDASGRMRVTAIKNDVFTAASTGIGLREIGDPISPTKAGALTTTDLPYSGMIGVDTTNSRLYVNVAGTVKSVVVA